MTSLQTSMKQSHGYFLTVGTGTVGYTYAGASGAGGSFTPGTMTKITGAEVATPLLAAGAVMRDMGKTVYVGALNSTAGVATVAAAAGANTRVFRKVQLLNTVGTTDTGATGTNAVTTNGVSGPATSVAAGVTSDAYQTFYIELPTLGRGSGGAASIVPGAVDLLRGRRIGPARRAGWRGVVAHLRLAACAACLSCGRRRRCPGAIRRGRGG